jgi:hypothetical protein
MNDENTGSSTKQRHDVFVVDNYTDKNDGSESANWIRVGVAFPHKDRKGFNIELKAMPTSGKLVIREHEPKSKQ